MRDFVAYAAGFDPGFPQRVRSASAAEIAELEQLMRAPLPEDYRQFLSLVGEDDGGLRIGSDSSTRVRDLCDYYADIRADDDYETMVPEGAIVIAYSGVRTPELCLTLEDEPFRVFFASANQKLGDCAESLEKLVFRSVFSNLRRKRTSASLVYQAKSPSVHADAAAAVATRLGFTAEWFSDGICQCWSRPGTLLLVERILDRPLWLRVSGADERELQEVGDTLGRELSLSFRLRLNESGMG